MYSQIRSNNKIFVSLQHTMMRLEEMETARECMAQACACDGVGVCQRGLGVLPHEISVVMSSVGCSAEHVYRRTHWGTGAGNTPRQGWGMGGSPDKSQGGHSTAYALAPLATVQLETGTIDSHRRADVLRTT